MRFFSSHHAVALIAALAVAMTTTTTLAFVVPQSVPSSANRYSYATVTATTTTASTTNLMMADKNNQDGERLPYRPTSPFFANNFLQGISVRSAALALAFSLSFGASAPLAASATSATDSAAIVKCLVSKCQLPLAKCIANPKCLANVACIQTCNGKEDEIGCQIQCGDLFENEVVGDFNKCAVSEMNCVPQKKDEGLYPEPKPGTLVPKFDTKLWNGKWYITAGQNALFDIFPCQVHFFTETSPGTFYGNLNWRVEQPDGEYFTRDALQQFVQDPKDPAHLINHDNEYLHYKDDWYIVDFEYDDNPDGIPPFAFVYYRGSNDAWDGYGGVVVYTRDAKLPTSLLPRLREAAKKVGFDYDKDFTATDNSCPVINDKDRIVLREKFAGKVALQTEQQLQAAATRLRGNVVNSSKAQKIFFEQQSQEAQKAYNTLGKSLEDFEEERAKAAAAASAGK